VGGVSEPLLGADCGRGFLHRGSVDSQRSAEIHGVVFIELSTRKVQIAGVASAPNGLWMSQIGRTLTDAVDGILKDKRYLIHDRDPLFTAELLDLLARLA